MLKILTMVIIAFLPIALNSNDQVLKLIEHCFTDTDGDNYKKELVAQGMIDPEFSDYSCSEINRMSPIQACFTPFSTKCLLFGII